MPAVKTGFMPSSQVVAAELHAFRWTPRLPATLYASKLRGNMPELPVFAAFRYDREVAVFKDYGAVEEDRFVFDHGDQKPLSMTMIVRMSGEHNETPQMR